MKNKFKLNLSQIKQIQKELYELNILEEFTDYKISAEYLDLFLKRYSELEGEYGHIQGAILTSLFDFIKKKESNVNDSELVNKSHKLYPVIKAMLIKEKIFKLINDAKKGKLNKDNEG